MNEKGSKSRKEVVNLTDIDTQTEASTPITEPSAESHTDGAETPPEKDSGEKNDDKKGKKSKKEEKKKKLPLGRTIANNAYALRLLWLAAPVYLIFYLGSSVGWGILEFLQDTYLLRMIVNNSEAGVAWQKTVIYIAVIGVTCVLWDMGMNYYFNVCSPKCNIRIASYIKQQLYRKSASVELACYETPSFYDKYVKAMDEANERVRKVMRTLDSLISSVVALAANSFLLFVIDPWLIVFGLFPLLLGVFKRMENVEKHNFEVAKKPIDRRRKYIRRTFYLNEYAKEVRVGGMYRCMLRDLGESFNDFRAIMRKHGYKRAILAYVQKIGLEVVTILGAMLYATWRTVGGEMSVGDCLVILGSVESISYCLNNLVQNLAEFGEHALFLEDVRFFLSYEPKITSPADAKPAHAGDITLENVSFRYEGSEADTLHDVNMTWKQGERIALVGQNGSGKTTLVKLLLRLYDPSTGRVALDGEDIRSLDLASWHENFETVFQDYKMFAMSVHDNVLLRLPQDRAEDDKLVEDALRQSGAWDKISSLEQGADTMLTREFDDKGTNLSGGEAQKVSLARVFAHPTPYVILDEPSSALDPIAEYRMFENMMRATEGRSVIFISHRLSSAALADKVYLMENGTITEAGTHHELMALGGKYAEMFHRQAENYLGEEETV